MKRKNLSIKMKMLPIAILLVLMIIVGCMGVDSVSSTQDDTLHPIRPVIQDLSSHGPIEISSDSDPDLAEFDGTGTPGDPYIIENWEINSSDSDGILIHDTTVSFRIKNCLVDGDQYGISLYENTGEFVITDNALTGNSFTAIYINDVDGAQVVNNTLYDNWGYGIYVNLGSPNTLIYNNTIEDNNNHAIFVDTCNGVEITLNEITNARKHIYVETSNNLNVTANTCIGSSYELIELLYCDPFILHDNYCENGLKGIMLDESANGDIEDNTCINNKEEGIYAVGTTACVFTSNDIENNDGFGFRLNGAETITLTDNIFTSDGLYIDDMNPGYHDTHTLSGNTVNGKTLGYFVSTSGATLSAGTYGQVIMYNCSNMVIGQQTISNTDFAIHVENCTDVDISDNTCENNLEGICAKDSDVITIKDNICNNNIQQGIFTYITNATITSNDCANNNRGIEIYGAVAANITSNTCEDNVQMGIHAWESPEVNVSHNTIYDSAWMPVQSVHSSIDDMMAPSNIFLTPASEAERFGILMFGCLDAILTDNDLINTGIAIEEMSVEEYKSYTIANNQINGKPLGVFFDLDTHTFDTDTYGQLFLINCTNVDITGLEFTNMTVGVVLRYSTEIDITELDVHHCAYGVDARGGGNISVSFSDFSYADAGVMMMSSGDIVIANVTSLLCTTAGIQLLLVQDAIINNSICAYGEGEGIQLYDVDNSIVTNTLLQENAGYGVDVESSSGNVIHHNAFYDNNQGDTQAYDSSGSANTWYDTSTNEGNYWDDYVGSGAYVIDGGSLFTKPEDPYPLADPNIVTIAEFSKQLGMVGLFIIPTIMIIVYRRKKQIKRV